MAKYKFIPWTEIENSEEYKNASWIEKQIMKDRYYQEHISQIEDPTLRGILFNEVFPEEEVVSESDKILEKAKSGDIPEFESSIMEGDFSRAGYALEKEGIPRKEVGKVLTEILEKTSREDIPDIKYASPLSGRGLLEMIKGTIPGKVLSGLGKTFGITSPEDQITYAPSPVLGSPTLGKGLHFLGSFALDPVAWATLPVSGVGLAGKAALTSPGRAFLENALRTGGYLGGHEAAGQFQQTGGFPRDLKEIAKQTLIGTAAGAVGDIAGLGMARALPKLGVPPGIPTHASLLGAEIAGSALIDPLLRGEGLPTWEEIGAYSGLEAASHLPNWLPRFFPRYARETGLDKGFMPNPITGLGVPDVSLEDVAKDIGGLINRRKQGQEFSPSPITGLGVPDVSLEDIAKDIGGLIKKKKQEREKKRKKKLKKIDYEDL